MTPYPEERQMLDTIQRRLGRRDVLVAGSRAIGTATATSDWDLVVGLPLALIPLAAGRLRQVKLELEGAVGVPVSLSPVPTRLLAEPARNLFLWKLEAEGRVLASEAHRTAAVIPVLPPSWRWSYAMSAAIFLLDSADPSALAAGTVPPAMRRSIEKAMLHLAQIRLLERGRYESSAATAFESEPGLLSLAADAAQPRAFFAARDAVVDELGRGGARRAVAGANIRYVGAAALQRRNRVRALACRASVENGLAAAARELLVALRPQGVDAAASDRAREELPPWLRRDGWEQLRDVVVHEWPIAHPVLAQ
jgi:predicted nucleotidyltransferase